MIELPERVAVVGAAGKMGRGIALLAHRLLEEVKGERRLLLLDRPEADYEELRRYLEQYGELSPYVEFSDDYNSAADCTLFFEAVVEDVEEKAAVLTELRQVAPETSWFLTNTSSIPIQELAKRSGLEGRLMGFHFYQPAPVQRLVELVKPDGMRPELGSLAQVVAQRLDKQIVESGDVAGFIGNGMLLRELRYACEEIAVLGMPLHEGVALVDAITERLLVRPMGIFRVIDYIGHDVVRRIGEVMTCYISGADFHLSLLERIEGRAPTFFSYDKGRIDGVWDFEREKYVPLPEGGEIEGMEAPEWKALRHNSESNLLLRDYFSRLGHDKRYPARMAMDYLFEMREIAEQLVRDGVAADTHSVNRVMLEGFAHLYGPESSLIVEREPKDDGY